MSGGTPSTCPRTHQPRYSEEYGETGDIDVQPVNPDGGQVLDVEGDEGTREAVTHVRHLLVRELRLELAREAVRLILELAAHGVHEDADDGLERRQQHLRCCQIMLAQTAQVSMCYMLLTW